VPLTHEEYTLLRDRLERADKIQQIENLQHTLAGFTAGIAAQAAAARHTQPQHMQAPQPRPVAQHTRAAQPATSATLPSVIDGSARFHPNHLKMKSAASMVDPVKDSYVFSPGATIRQR
jgi:hypothetical protein